MYAARVFSNNYRIGKNYVTDFEMRVLNDKYSEDGLFEKAMDFLKEIISNPNVKDNKFDKNLFDIIKNDELSQINRLREDQRKYSTLKLLEYMDSDSPISYNTKGYAEDLNKITRENLYDFYCDFIKNPNVDIFIVGDIDFDYISNIILEKFSFLNKNKNEDISLLLDYKKHREKRLEIVESDNTNQAKLSIGCTIENMTKKERDYVLNVYNLLLGGTADSKFFKNIREKFSLCYYVSSRAFKQDNILLINSGITKDNYSKIMILIDKEMNDVRNGVIDDEEIEKAKKYYVASLDEVDDSPSQIIASYYAMDKLHVDEIEKRKKNIMKITKEDIIELANKVYIDTVYLLGGDKK